jgi:soluble lytic murein transglycosylase-like protein
MTTSTPPERVVLQALYQQRIYRLLGGAAGFARKTIAHLTPRLARIARSHRSATVGLKSLVTAIPDASAFKIGRAEPPGVLLRLYKQAERRFGVDWEVLAAVNYIETKWNRVRSMSSAGAQGPMQFMPATWGQYGMGGDIHDPRDAIMAAANYLQASGAPDDYQQAIYAYNHSDAYVNAILQYAHRMMEDPKSFYQYFSWQVFVLTTKGPVRLTGPGK